MGPLKSGVWGIKGERRLRVCEVRAIKEGEDQPCCGKEKKDFS